MNIWSSLTINRRRQILLSPAILFLLGGIVFPMLIVAIVSISRTADYGDILWGKLSANAYIQFLFEQDLDERKIFNLDYIFVFLRSLKLALLTTFGCLILGFPTALFIALQPVRRRNTLLILVSIPFWANLLVRLYAWIILLRDGGGIEQFLHWLHLKKDELGLMYTSTATAIGLLYAFIPFMILPIYASLEKIDWRLVDAACDLGANRWQALRRIITPLALPGIISGCTLVFVPTLGVYVIPDILGGSKSLMIGNLIHLQYTSAHNWPFGAALSFVLLGLTLLGMLMCRFCSKRTGKMYECV
ncbi:ABC transporter permease [Mycoavidus sp. B2-EB]|uniref:ABC transporter permease n=1 Tax=Mycoavidus sp. B2-EB TaxID=2651972 RepID=UPI0016240A81|nr:ABC transporter permease [Mycoavidus sp. B2-EB]BBO59817.1 ABC transporter permease [Mycoavidus sp. B2-EB]